VPPTAGLPRLSFGLFFLPCQAIPRLVVDAVLQDDFLTG
jgi:hypothetical protein